MAFKFVHLDADTMSVWGLGFKIFREDFFGLGFLEFRVFRV